MLGLVLLAAFGISVMAPVSISAGVGDEVERPLAGTAPDEQYELGIGDLTVDLSDAAIAPGRTEVDVRLGIGDLVVTVPDDVALEIDARAGVGHVDLLGEEEDGVDAEENVSVPGPTADAPVLVLDADVAIGNLEIEREDDEPVPLPFALPPVRRAQGEGALAGVCAGIAKSLGVDVTLVRLTFALLAFAGGAGIVAYAGAWLAMAPEDGPEPSSRRRLVGYALLAIAAALALRGIGLADSLLWPAAALAVGFLLTRRGGSRAVIGLALIAAGVIVFVDQNADGGGRDTVLESSGVAIALLLVLGPWAWRLVAERDAERTARIRSQERAEMAARVHDSVLQTLALVQRGGRRSAPGLRARTQAGAGASRLALSRPPGRPTPASPPRSRPWQRRSRSCTRSRRARPHRRRPARRAHGGTRTRGTRGDGERGPALGRRRDLVFVDVGDEDVAVFVRDRGSGFDPDAVADDAHGIAESIRGRMNRAGGSARALVRLGRDRGRATTVEAAMSRRASSSSRITTSSARACAASSATRSRSSARRRPSPKRCR